MKEKTYHTLKRAYLGAVDPKAISQALQSEEDPHLFYDAQLLTKTTSFRVDWNKDIFTTEFKNDTPQRRLEETVMIFLLRLAGLLKGEIHIRTFIKPGSQQVIHAWIILFKSCLISITSLLYKTSWTIDNYIQLDNLILDLIYKGQVQSLRTFMVQQLNINMTNSITEAESKFEKLKYLTIGQFGSSFWRLLHWMAEAMDRPDRDAKAKNIWRTLMIGSLYRLLSCGICINHMNKIVQELKPQLMDENTVHQKLWFNIHNKVSSNKIEGNSHYSESEFEEDVLFMQQALEI